MISMFIRDNRNVIIHVKLISFYIWTIKNFEYFEAVPVFIPNLDTLRVDYAWEPNACKRRGYETSVYNSTRI